MLLCGRQSSETKNGSEIPDSGGTAANTMSRSRGGGEKQREEGGEMANQGLDTKPSSKEDSKWQCGRGVCEATVGQCYEDNSLMVWPIYRLVVIHSAEDTSCISFVEHRPQVWI